MFRSATAKVALLSVAITMGISLLFSLAIYHAAAAEIRSSARRQYVRFRNQYDLPLQFSPNSYSQEEAEVSRHLITNLVYLNLVILGLSALIGYYWARQTLEPIEKAMLMQGQFTADASHELRTPLAAMRSEIEVALRAKQITEKEARALLTSNLEEIAKLEGLASGLLQLARLESATSKLERCSIGGVIAIAAKSLGPQAKAKKVKITSSGSDFQVMGEPDSLGQVFKILIDNAIKYGKTAGQVEITTKSSGHRGVITVRDDGPGISADDLPHVFERFWRANSSRSQGQIEGFGLGLAIAREIVLLHKGEIRVESVGAAGSRFIIELPLA